MVGKILSHYRILDELGRGGMGIVYRAEDTKLDRTVAIKVLPAAALASDDDRARFYREAKAAAQLHHPHIASIFGIDEAVPEGTRDEDLRPFIAMEYVEGETLHDRIQKGPLKLEHSVRIATQIASGLEAAHEKNIVHRDVKSGNVMLTKKGDAKILDFGLAQTAHSTKLTRMGSTLGTVAYMSPEQARGEEVDGRSDLYSLGTVLYEMITGRLPFSAEYEQAAIYSILNEDPEPLTAVRTGVPMALESIVTKALRKDADLRYQTARDFIADLKALDLSSVSTSRIQTPPVSSASESVVPATAGEVATNRNVTVQGILLGIAIAAAAFLSVWFLLPERQEAAPPEPLVFFESSKDVVWAELSPDGESVAYVARDTVWVRDLAGSRWVPLARLGQNAQALFWSPSSDRIGFIDGDLVKSIQTDGSNEIRAGRIPPVEGVDAVTWSPEDSIYILLSYGGANAEIVTIPASGGNLSPYWEFRASEDDSFVSDMAWHGPTASLLGSMVSTQIGETFSIQIIKPRNDRLAAQSAALSAATRAETPYLSFALDPAGFLLLNRDGNIWAQRIEFESLAPIGSPHIVMSNTVVERVGSNGLLLGKTRTDYSGFNVVLVDPESTELTVVGPVDYPLMMLSFSPDGTRAAGVADGAYIIDLDRGDVRRIYDGRVTAISEWLPETLGISVSIYMEEGGANIYLLDPDAVSEPAVLINGPESEFYPTLSPDQTKLMYYVAELETGRDLWIADVSIRSDSIRVVGEPVAWYAGSNEDVLPSWHPSGNWILYAANHTGEYQVYLREYPSARREQRVSVGEGFDPKFSPNGDRIYYRDSDALYSVDILDATTMRLSSPVRMMDFRANQIVTFTQLESSYDVHPATGALIFSQSKSAALDSEILFISNWQGLLEN